MRRKAGLASAAGALTSRSMMVLQTFTHESQMYTPGPAIIFFTSACDLPQKEQSVMREDLAMVKGGAPGAPVSRSEIVLKGSSGGALHHDGLGLAGGLDEVVHVAVGLCLLGTHVIIAIRILLNLLGGLAGVQGDGFVERLAPTEDLPGRNGDVGRLATRTAARLVDHDAAVGERKALALRSARQQHGAHARGAADAISRDVIPHRE